MPWNPPNLDEFGKVWPRLQETFQSLRVWLGFNVTQQPGNRMTPPPATFGVTQNPGAGSAAAAAMQAPPSLGTGDTSSGGVGGGPPRTRQGFLPD
jgi:hypothetical protein